MNNKTLFPELHKYCQALEAEFDLIPTERKNELNRLSEYFAKKYQQKISPQVTVICTHNSRRSHLGQVWLAVGADYFQLPALATYSGGTEATAFNPRAVTALHRIGFKITSNEASTNPIYKIKWQEDMKPYAAFSKKYDIDSNPSTNFAAIMVCNSADKGCPIVHGADFRISLPFEDPKAFDDTALETEKYRERCRQIGREMLFVLEKLSD